MPSLRCGHRKCPAEWDNESSSFWQEDPKGGGSGNQKSQEDLREKSLEKLLQKVVDEFLGSPGSCTYMNIIPDSIATMLKAELKKQTTAQVPD